MTDVEKLKGLQDSMGQYASFDLKDGTSIEGAIEGVSGFGMNPSDWGITIQDLGRKRYTIKIKDIDKYTLRNA